uniref:Collagen-like protein n=1 Tax=uncultured actinobacterium Rifle_16ft_4_minimus_38826 TaxID=1665148 RepID=A0A0H4T7U3_9ACTN|nr:hypothetical protein [uncultured actinobacterium Rifle_16ft_4_minimus_38826]
MGPTGATGPQGVQGLLGPTGPTGAGVVGWEIVTSSQTDSADKLISVSCSPGANKVLGGGYQISGVSAGDSRKLVVTQSYPSSSTVWTTEALEAQSVGVNWTLSVYAICGVA